MAYPKEIRESLTDYCNDGHSVREAQEKFVISKSTASLWLRTASGSRRKSSPHPVKHPEKTVLAPSKNSHRSPNGAVSSVVQHYDDGHGVRDVTDDLWGVYGDTDELRMGTHGVRSIADAGDVLELLGPQRKHFEIPHLMTLYVLIGDMRVTNFASTFIPSSRENRRLWVSRGQGARRPSTVSRVIPTRRSPTRGQVEQTSQARLGIIT